MEGLLVLEKHIATCRTLAHLMFLSSLFASNSLSRWEQCLAEEFSLVSYLTK